jgi:hypothetical protein
MGEYNYEEDADFSGRGNYVERSGRMPDCRLVAQTRVSTAMSGDLYQSLRHGQRLRSVRLFGGARHYELAVIPASASFAEFGKRRHVKKPALPAMTSFRWEI